MLPMTDLADSPHTFDICLLLRAHGEQRWLNHELVSLVRQLEAREIVAEDQLGAALAYLEALWIDARRRAAETDAAFAQLDHATSSVDHSVRASALRYHTAVRRLRGALGRRVQRLLASESEVQTPEHASF
jgi:hypothetical protein